MNNKLTLIESDVLDELIEYYFAFKQLDNPRSKHVLGGINWTQVKLDKEAFLEKYVNIDINLNEEIEKELKRRGYN